MGTRNRYFEFKNLFMFLVAFFTVQPLWASDDAVVAKTPENSVSPEASQISSELTARSKRMVFFIPSIYYRSDESDVNVLTKNNTTLKIHEQVDTWVKSFSVGFRLTDNDAIGLSYQGYSETMTFSSAGYSDYKIKSSVNASALFYQRNLFGSFLVTGQLISSLIPSTKSMMFSVKFSNEWYITERIFLGGDWINFYLPIMSLDKMLVFYPTIRVGMTF